MATVYLNGVWVPADEARVSVWDRAFLFGDAVYEVIPVYGRRCFGETAHLTRLARSLEALRIPDPLDRDGWRTLLVELVARNEGEHQAVYLQVSRGAPPTRDHAFPVDTAPTVLAMSSPLADTLLSVDALTPVSAVCREDIRWDRCDIKATALLANVLLRQEAIDAGAQEAILLRDGRALEGAASNLFVVVDDRLHTAPPGPLILGGVTRDIVLARARAADLPVTETAVTETDLRRATEIFLTSSTREIMPVTRLDGQPVGDGTIGPVCRRLTAAYLEDKQAFIAGVA